MSDKIKAYRKIPIVIKAIRLNAENLSTIREWLWDKYICHYEETNGADAIQIKTLEGRMTIPFGHYIIQGIEGEFYGCKYSIFNATYEEIKEETTP